MSMSVVNLAMTLMHCIKIISQAPSQPKMVLSSKPLAIPKQAILQHSQHQTASDSNILLIGGTYQAGDAGSTILQAGQDSIYDKETQVSKRGKIKRKTTVTTTTEQIADGEAVKLNANANANAITVQANDNLYAYATEFNAPAGQIQLKSGEAFGLYAV